MYFNDEKDKISQGYKTVSFWLSKEQRKHIDKISAYYSWSKSKAIRFMLDFYMKNKKKALRDRKTK